jgi:hypothetical protein
MKILLDDEELEVRNERMQKPPFCPFCGKIVFHLWRKTQNEPSLVTGAGTDMIYFCKKCKVFWYVDNVYFSMKKYESDVLKVI